MKNLACTIPLATFSVFRSLASALSFSVMTIGLSVSLFFEFRLYPIHKSSIIPAETYKYSNFHMVLLNVANGPGLMS